MNAKEIHWQQKFDQLKSKVLELSENIDMNLPPFEVSDERCCIQAKVIYVNFDFMVTDSEHYALHKWGEGNYDVYDLNKDQSPEDTNE